MATINKRLSGKWQATVRRTSHSPSKTFTKRADAVKWARVVETEAERTGIVSHRALAGADTASTFTLADALRHLANEQDGERWRLHALARTQVAKLRINVLTVDDFAQWREQRMLDAKPSTVVRELSLMQTAIDRQLGEYAESTANPVRHLRRPRVDDRRERRLTDHEWHRLRDAAGKCLNPLMRPLLVLPRETAMRRGELLSMEWCNVDLDACTVLLPKTKNGHARLVQLSPQAVAILAELYRNDERVLPMTTIAVRLAWQRLRAHAGVVDIRPHDLRAQAATHKLLDEWSVAEVQVLTGHRDAGVLLERYARLRATDVVAKLHAQRARE